MIRPYVEGSFPNHSLHTAFCYDKYESVRSHVQSSADLNLFWNESIGENNFSFIGMVQVYTKKSVACLIVNGIVASSLHVTFLQFIKEFH